jgi:hypothetical protein
MDWNRPTRRNRSRLPGLGRRVRRWCSFANGAFALALISLAGSSPVSALTIVRDFIGGEQRHSDTGTGNLHDIFNAAADIWESIILDGHVVTLHYGWASNGGGEHFLNAQGGTPNRETEGTILFNNDDVVGHHHFYLDPTPRRSEEYPGYLQVFQDMGGGTVNVTRLYTGGTGAAGLEDLLSTALHEIGHALGMRLANTSFIGECADGNIGVTSPRPFAGSLIPMASNAGGVTSHIDGDVAGRWARIRRAGASHDARYPGVGSAQPVREAEPRSSPPVRNGPELMVSWQPLLPTTQLLASDALGATLSWVQTTHPIQSSGNGLSIHFTPAKPKEFFRLATTPDVPRTISTGQNAVDANPAVAGIQVSAGSTVTYSGSITGLPGEILDWGGTMRWTADLGTSSAPAAVRRLPACRSPMMRVPSARPLCGRLMSSNRTGMEWEVPARSRRWSRHELLILQAGKRQVHGPGGGADTSRGFQQLSEMATNLGNIFRSNDQVAFQRLDHEAARTGELQWVRAG